VSAKSRPAFQTFAPIAMTTSTAEGCLEIILREGEGTEITRYALF